MKAVSHLADSRAPAGRFDVARIRENFPILQQKVHGKPLVYFDNGATSQKPQTVIDALAHYYSAENSNIHRGVHYLSERATAAYEEARSKIRGFINARNNQEIIFVRGTTEAINLVTQSYGRTFLKAGDEIIISAMEHHSNIVPWQMLCEQIGAKLRVIPINHDGEIVMDEYRRLLNEKTKFVSVTHVSNALGTIAPVKEIVALAHERSIPVLLDGAQAVPPHISGGIGLGAAIDYLQALDWQGLTAHEHALLGYATESLSNIDGLRIIGTAKEKAGVLSFVFDHVHAHDVGTILDQEGVAVRSGHHCAMPVMQRFGVPATTRASFAFYNTT